MPAPQEFNNLAQITAYAKAQIPRDSDQRSELKPIGLTVVVRNGDRHEIGTAA